MLTRTSEYALRAMVHLAQHEEDWPMTGKDIATAADIPAKYLSKILGDLVRVGVLESTPGRRGGFRFRQPANKTRLYDVLAPFEHVAHKRCPFGNTECNDGDPCIAHDSWKKVVAAKMQFLQERTVHDVAMRTKRRRHAGRKKSQSDGTGVS